MIPRTFTVYQALAAGAKTMAQLRTLLGWSSKDTARAVESLLETGQALRRTRPGVKRFVYEVAR